MNTTTTATIVPSLANVECRPLANEFAEKLAARQEAIMGTSTIRGAAQNMWASMRAGQVKNVEFFSARMVEEIEKELKVRGEIL